MFSGSVLMNSTHAIRSSFGSSEILKLFSTAFETRSTIFGYCFISAKQALPARTPWLVSTAGKQVCVQSRQPVHRKRVSSTSGVQPIFHSMIALTRAFFPRGVAHSLPLTVYTGQWARQKPQRLHLAISSYNNVFSSSCFMFNSLSSKNHCKISNDQLATINDPH